ncbi:MAG: hypothetical protein IT383_26430 [Deltaproteobacteria bacterium]|nr:hypothetical protein [Deltaproteobacteria bacterium]
MVTGPLLILLCAAAPNVAAWLEEAVAIAPASSAEAADDGAAAAAQRVRSVVDVAAAVPRPVRAPAVPVLVREPVAPAPPLRARLVLETSPAQPQGPPRA